MYKESFLREWDDIRKVAAMGVQSIPQIQAPKAIKMDASMKAPTVPNAGLRAPKPPHVGASQTLGT